MKTCICMIVKNAGQILRVTLNSFLPHVDHFCICDTGSTDSTLDILDEETACYDGYLFREEFVDFSHNRNRVLEEAEKRYPGCYYITIDDSYTLADPEAFVSFFRQADKPAYYVTIRNDKSRYLSIKVSTQGMRFRYRIHELIQPPETPPLAYGITFIEHRPEDHEKRTAARAEFDLVCLRKDLAEHPKDPRLMFYIARTLYNQDKLLEAAEWFKERIQCPEGCRYEKYQSMIYITLIAERTHHTPKELLDLYLGIYKLFPDYKETLYYAALSAAEMEQHEQAIKMLEEAYYADHHAQFCVKHIILEKEIPRMLCNYYFKLDLSKCVPFLFKHYISRELPFDYRYESYIRLIFRIEPKVIHPTRWVVYSDNLSSFPLPIEDATVLDSSKDLVYQSVVTSYSIPSLLVVNRVDRIPYFPNVSSIYFMVLNESPEGGVIDVFPMLKAIIAKDAAHAARLKEKYLSPAAARIVITVEQFLMLVSPADLALFP
jgi:glycosyltransferase involved in cell wall biosynthesis